jgi:ATPase subunit of ABC transporter with duplicated ATPase domains
MLSTNGISLKIGKRTLFEDVNIKFLPGNCYGLIGANGAGKSTFLQVLSGEIEPTGGDIFLMPGERIGVLKQDHFEYAESDVSETVMMGHARLFGIMREKETIYAKPDFSDEDGIYAAELEDEFNRLNGWQADTEVTELLMGLGIDKDLHHRKMKDLSGDERVRVLLAQALFGSPDILLLDEPTNHLDLKSITWLENFLYTYENTVIVVSHDRHFLNKVCTHIVDIDYGKCQLYVGNYDFWVESSQLALRLMRESNRKKEDKIEELQRFIERFSSNASKAKQATSRKRQLEKLTLDDIKPSSRKYPYINFTPDREVGHNVLEVKDLGASNGGMKLFDNLSFVVNKGDKIAFVGPNGIAKTAMFQILMGEILPDSGEFSWGTTTTQAYLPLDYASHFETSMNLVEWLRQYSRDPDETYLRGFLGRMLFSGDESQKQMRVLSGGERVRCMLARVMLSGANVLILDEPTNHLDMESITSLNNALTSFGGIVLFVSQDHQFVQTVANRIMEITPEGLIDRRMTFDEYYENSDTKA